MRDAKLGRARHLSLTGGQQVPPQYPVLCLAPWLDRQPMQMPPDACASAMDEKQCIPVEYPVSTAVLLSQYGPSAEYYAMKTSTGRVSKVEIL